MQLGHLLVGVILYSVTYAQRNSTQRTTATRTELRLCILAERGSDDLFYNYDRSSIAVDLAVQYANEMILSDIGFNISYLDVNLGPSCTIRNHAGAHVLDLFQRGVHCDALMGGGCVFNQQSIYDVAEAYNILTIGVPAAGIGIQASRSEYSLLARIGLSHTGTTDAFLRVLKHFNYTHMSFLKDDHNSYFQELSLTVDQVWNRYHPELIPTTKFTLIKSNKVTDEEIDRFLTDASTRSRVIFILTPGPIVRRVMLRAHRMKMTTGDYIFMAVQLFPSLNWGNLTWQNNDEHDQDVRDAFRVLMQFILEQPIRTPIHEHFLSEVKYQTNRRGNYFYAGNAEPDLMTAHFYDAVIFYSDIVKRQVTRGRDYRNAMDISRILPNFTFYSPSYNDVVYLDASGDRLNKHWMQSFHYELGIHMPFVGFPPHYDPPVKTIGYTEWPSLGNHLPPDVPYCGFTGNNPRCANGVPMNGVSRGSLAAAIAIPLLLIIVGMVMGGKMLRKYVLEQTDYFWWRIFAHEVELSSPQSMTNLADEPKDADDRLTMKTKVTTETWIHEASYEKGVYQDNLVLLATLPPDTLRITHAMESDLANIKLMRHQNLQKFYGIVVSDHNFCQYVVGEFCAKGTLTNLLSKDNFELDWPFQCSLMKDVSAGMQYLHANKPHSHGNLTADTCLVDSNFVLKISDYSLGHFRLENFLQTFSENEGDERDVEMLLWRAPELLRNGSPAHGTPKGDVYSFAILVQQILLRTEPFGSSDPTRDRMPANELLVEIKRGTVPPVRPRIPRTTCPPMFLELIGNCWDEIPAKRPTFGRVRDEMNQVMGRTGENIVEHLIRSMEKQTASLETEIAEKVRSCVEEKQRADELLSQILPRSVAAALVRGQAIAPQTYSSTTVHFSTVHGFKQMIEEAKTGAEKVAVMNNIYVVFDAIIETYDVYKVETHNEMHLIISGLPEPNGIKHASEIASMTLSLRKEVAKMKISYLPHIKLTLRAGLHSGPCVAGIVGMKTPRYCLFGDTVNTSSRMKTHGEGGKIQCSASTAELLDQLGGFILVRRGIIDVKGKGEMETYWVIAEER